MVVSGISISLLPERRRIAFALNHKYRRGDFYEQQELPLQTGEVFYPLIRYNPIYCYELACDYVRLVSKTLFSHPPGNGTHPYSLLFGIPGLFVAGIIALVLFGDEPWPSHVEQLTVEDPNLLLINGYYAAFFSL